MVLCSNTKKIMVYHKIERKLCVTAVSLVNENPDMIYRRVCNYSYKTLLIIFILKYLILKPSNFKN